PTFLHPSELMPATLHALELTLWSRETRFDRALMDATFAPDFHEFGRSGRRYSRDQMLFDASDAQDIDATLHDFTEHPLSDTITLCTYVSEVRTPDGPERANRASIWDCASGRWQLRFHQGTAIP
ncbi:MAG: nuclear transport factor 2 family protein, partial [bacterium]